MTHLRLVAGLVVALQAAGAAAAPNVTTSSQASEPGLPALAQRAASGPTSVYEPRWVPAVTLTAAALGLWGITDNLVVPTLASSRTCRRSAAGFCDPSELSALDRSTVGRHSRGWERATNAAMLALPAAALVSVAVDALAAGGPTSQRLHRAGTEAFVVVESTAVAVLLTSTLKLAVRRPRPRQYGAGVSSSVESDLSFPSGHTSLVAASLAAAATTLSLRHPQWRYRLPAWAVVAAATTTMGIGRVAAGWHFPSDVMGGALLGVACGLVVPLLQVAPVTLQPSVGAQGALPLLASWSL